MHHARSIAALLVLVAAVGALAMFSGATVRGGRAPSGEKHLRKARHVTPDPHAAAAARAAKRRANTQTTSSKATRIVNGTTVSTTTFPVRWPFIASLVDISTGHFCGGSTLSPTLILTAAHCVVSDSGGILRPSTLDIAVGKRLRSETTGQVIDVKAVMPHPAYNPHTQINDVALIRLATPTSVPTISIATDPKMWGNGNGLAESANGAWIGGWGVTSSGSLNIPDGLRETSINVVSDQACTEAYAYEFISTSMICASDTAARQDTCQGDSGGPMTMRNPATGKYELIGVTSWGYGCADPQHPGVYTRITTDALRGFINSIPATSGGAQGIQDPATVQATPELNAATVTWTPPASGPKPDFYRVYYYNPNAGLWYAKPALPDTTGTSLRVTGLAQATPYTFVVRSFIGAGMSPGTTLAQIRTLDNTPPSKPGKPQIVQRYRTSLEFDWSKSSDNYKVKHYEVWIKGANDWWQNKIVGADPARTTVTTLTAGRTYSFKLRAVDMDGNKSVFSDSSTFTTLT